MFLDAFLSKYPYTDFHELNLDFLLKNYKFLLDSLVKIDGWIDEHQVEYEQLKALYDAIVSGNFPEEMRKALYDWTVHNAQPILGEIAKMCFFVIDTEGYFKVYIPDSWDEITFGTSGLDDFPAGVDFGHLTLSY